MAKTRSETVNYQIIELGGVRYAVLREVTLLGLCRNAGALANPGQPASIADPLEEERLDGEDLARRLLARRKGLGVPQAALAELAGIRVETLNRIERGKVTPDFATIRKLVVALREAERADAART